MKLHRTKVVVGKRRTGEIAVIGGEMAVCCGENAVQLMEIQPENGKRYARQRLSARSRDRSKGEGSVIWRLLPEKTALTALSEVTENEGYSNIVIDKSHSRGGLSPRDAALASTIFYGVWKSV